MKLRLTIGFALRRLAVLLLDLAELVDPTRTTATIYVEKRR